MTRKTGKVALKARQQLKAAKMAMSKRELSEAGISLTAPRPSAKAMKEKEEEFKKLYFELFSAKESASETKPSNQEIQPQEQAQLPEQETRLTERQEQAQTPEQQEKTKKANEKQETQEGS
ncbi:MAG: hypothetical protein AB1476_04660 [Candidatus Hadarchaeota archaeon]